MFRQTSRVFLVPDRRKRSQSTCFVCDTAGPLSTAGMFEAATHNQLFSTVWSFSVVSMYYLEPSRPDPGRPPKQVKY